MIRWVKLPTPRRRRPHHRTPAEIATRALRRAYAKSVKDGILTLGMRAFAMSTARRPLAGDDREKFLRNAAQAWLRRKGIAA